MSNKVTWKRDEAYSGALTAYKVNDHANLAIVIGSPEDTGDGWQIQVFDEDNEEALENGETICRVDLPRWIEEDDAKMTAEALFF